MSEPRWLTADMVKAMHAENLAIFGGSAGVRDEGLLESALGRAQQLYHYGDDPTLFDLAAAYCAGISGNHPFVDGNKRAAVSTARVFLFLNGQRFRPEEASIVTVILALAAGEADEVALAAWMERSSTPVG